MINSIIESIIISLNAEFGDRYKICREEKQQDFQAPCFLVQCVNHECRLFFGKRYFRQNQFCIRYFPETKEKESEECCAVAERLFTCLKYLEMDDDFVMGTKMNYEMADGILHFSVNYDMFIYRIADAVPTMEEITSETSVEG